jgi:hypothetical protein
VLQEAKSSDADNKQTITVQIARLFMYTPFIFKPYGTLTLVRFARLFELQLLLPLNPANKLLKLQHPPVRLVVLGILKRLSAPVLIRPRNSGAPLFLAIIIDNQLNISNRICYRIRQGTIPSKLQYTIRFRALSIK